MPPKKRKKTSKFLKKDKLCMIEELKKEKYSDVVEKCVTIIREGVHLKLFDSRRKFIEELTEEKAKKPFMDLVGAMVDKYIALLKVYVTGKRFAQFEQAWLCHIEEYFTEPPAQAQTSTAISSEVSLHSMWKAVFDSIESKPSLEEQRIVVSTVAYTVYDLMTEKVKDYKINLAVSTTEPQAEPMAAAISTSKKRLYESNVNLYRYGGFALHSLLKKYDQQTPTSSHDQHTSQVMMHRILKQLKIKDTNQMHELPNAIHYLNRGGLDIMNTCMLPYLRIVIEKVSLLINEEKCHELGTHMIEVACKEIEDDADLFRTFVKCIDEAHVDVAAPAVAALIPRLHKELLRKMFHARVNEYMTASIGIELEKSGKAVQVEQSLRDQLKTFSGLKTR